MTNELNAAKRRYEQSQKDLLKTYSQTIEKYFSKINVSRKTEVLEDLEKIVGVLERDLESIQYEKGSFDKNIAKRFLKKHDLNYTDLAKKLNVGTSTLSIHLKQLENDVNTNTPKKQQILKEFSDLGYRPFKNNN